MNRGSIVLYFNPVQPLHYSPEVTDAVLSVKPDLMDVLLQEVEEY